MIDRLINRFRYRDIESKQIDNMHVHKLKLNQTDTERQNTKLKENKGSDC